MRRGNLIRAAISAVGLSLLLASPASAETPAVVVEELTDDGVYIAPQFDIDVASVAAAVADARRDGLTVVAIAPAQALPDAEAFGLRVLQASGTAGIEAVIVFTEDGEDQVVVVDEYHDRILRAVDAVRSAATPADAVASLTETLLAEDQPSVPAAIDVVQNWVVFLLLVLIAAVVADVLWRQRLRRQLAEQRAQAAAANEIAAHSKA